MSDYKKKGEKKRNFNTVKHSIKKKRKKKKKERKKTNIF